MPKIDTCYFNSAANMKGTYYSIKAQMLSNNPNLIIPIACFMCSILSLQIQLKTVHWLKIFVNLRKN